MAQRSVDVEMVVNATTDRVFDAFTNPIELCTWWGDEEQYHMTRCDLDLRKSGKWEMHGVFHQNDKPFTISGEYINVDRPFNLAFTWIQSWTPGVKTMVDITFMTDLNGTLVKVRHLSDPTEEAADGHRKGWEMVLGWLKAHLEPAPVASAVIDLDLDAIERSLAEKGI